MGIFDREKAQAAAPTLPPLEVQPMSITADQLQAIVDDWKLAEDRLKAELANRGEQLWAQAQAAVAAQNVNEFVRLSELLAQRPNHEQFDLRDAIFTSINKVRYTPAMMNIAEMISVSPPSSNPMVPELRMPASDHSELRPTFEP